MMTDGRTGPHTLCFKYCYIHIFEYMNDDLFGMHAELCKTLADKKRLKILSELAKQTGLRQANLSQHLAILMQKEVIASRKDGTAVYYKIAFPKMVKACNLIREVLLEQIQSRQKMVRRAIK